MLVFDGKAQASIVMHRDLRDGNTYRAYAAEYEALNRTVREFGTALAPHGPANFQFRTGPDGTLRTLFRHDADAGDDQIQRVELCIRKLLFGEAIRQPAVRSGVILRFLDELFVSQERIDSVS